ncbi:hypothetical protein Q7A53_01695 [Halobacillus rhizosphaerae]|uniref:hypothetical protein n=1 Tax=Halobacillus rhizosphaerae TaxID=3064889 RepID=UPI00398A7378
MVILLITLASISVVLFLFSFGMNDRFKDLENQVEQLSMKMMQDNYQMKQKMKILEEELLAEDLTSEILKNPYKKTASSTLPFMDKVKSMHNKGYKSHYIAKETNLEEHDVRSILQQFSREGGK